MQANKTFCQSLGYTSLVLGEWEWARWYPGSHLIAHLVCNEFLIAIQLLANSVVVAFPRWPTNFL